VEKDSATRKTSALIEEIFELNYYGKAGGIADESSLTLMLMVGAGETPRWALTTQAFQTPIPRSWKPGRIRNKILWRALIEVIKNFPRGFINALQALPSTHWIRTCNVTIPKDILAIHFGRPGPNQKVVIFRAYTSADIEVIKLPIGEKAKIQIKKEKAALISLQGKGIAPPIVLRQDFPALLVSKFQIGILPGIRTRASEERLQTKMLNQERLSKGDLEQFIIGRLIAADLPHEFALKVLLQLKEEIELVGTSSYSARIHGDFAPWNIRRIGEDSVALDWEDYDPIGPACWDLNYYNLSTSIRLMSRAECWSAITNGTYSNYLASSKLAVSQALTVAIILCNVERHRDAWSAKEKCLIDMSLYAAQRRREQLSS